MPVTHTPSAAGALFDAFAGQPFDDPVGYTAPDNKRIDAKYFLKPIQDEVLNLIQLALNGGAALGVRNDTGGTLPAGPVRVTGLHAASGRILIGLADADASAPAQLLLLTPLATASNGVAHRGGTFTSSLDTAAASIGAPVYLSASGGLTLTAPTGADQIVQVLGRVKTQAASGVIAGFVESPRKFGAAWLQPGSVDAAALAASVAGNGLAGGAGAALSVNVDDATIELDADALRVKNSGIGAAQLAAAVAGDGLTGGAGSPLAVNVDNSTVELSADALRIKDGAVGSAKMTGAAIVNLICGGRLTTETAVPVSSSDRIGVQCQTIYFTPFSGNRLALYDGARWQLYSFNEPSLALSSLTSGKNYDVFAYWAGSDVALELSAAWTNDTARADGLARLDGVWVKSAANTRRYLGTLRAVATNQTEDSRSKRFLWNFYNRTARHMSVAESADSWTYANTNWNAANNAAANKVEFVRGMADEIVIAMALSRGGNSSSVNAASGIGVDAANANSAQLFGATFFSSTALTALALYHGLPAAGYHYLAWIESSGATSTTWYGDGGSTLLQSGLIARIFC